MGVRQVLKGRDQSYHAIFGCRCNIIRIVVTLIDIIFVIIAHDCRGFCVDVIRTILVLSVDIILIHIYYFHSHCCLSVRELCGGSHQRDEVYAQLLPRGPGHRG